MHTHGHGTRDAEFGFEPFETSGLFSPSRTRITALDNALVNGESLGCPASIAEVSGLGKFHVRPTSLDLSLLEPSFVSSKVKASSFLGFKESLSNYIRGQNSTQTTICLHPQQSSSTLLQA